MQIKRAGKEIYKRFCQEQDKIQNKISGCVINKSYWSSKLSQVAVSIEIYEKARVDSNGKETSILSIEKVFGSADVKRYIEDILWQLKKGKGLLKSYKRIKE